MVAGCGGDRGGDVRSGFGGVGIDGVGARVVALWFGQKENGRLGQAREGSALSGHDFPSAIFLEPILSDGGEGFLGS